MLLTGLLPGCAGLQREVVSALGNTVLWAIERHGADSLNVDVQLGEVVLAEHTGKGSLRGLYIGNPKGFQTEGALEVERITVTIDPATLDDDIIVVDQVWVEAPVVTYELGPDGSNYDVLRKRARAYVDAHDTAMRVGKNLIIRDLRIQDGIIQFSHTWMDGEIMTVPLPEVHLTDIGTDMAGASPMEVADRLADELSQSVEQAMQQAGAQAEEVGEAIQEGMEAVGDTVEEWLEPEP